MAGRRMTLRASRYQPPDVSSGRRRATERRTRSALTRGPSTASSAGSTVSAASMSTTTVATPPYPIDRRNTSGKSMRLASATATVTPDTATVRPAVAMVLASAASVEPDLRSSSRNRPTTNSP
jgi:hypothetical protein